MSIKNGIQPFFGSHNKKKVNYIAINVHVFDLFELDVCVFVSTLFCIC